jgi:hypothetical protein
MSQPAPTGEEVKKDPAKPIPSCLAPSDTGSINRIDHREFRKRPMVLYRSTDYGKYGKSP